MVHRLHRRERERRSSSMFEYTGYSPSSSIERLKPGGTKALCHAFASEADNPIFLLEFIDGANGSDCQSERENAIHHLVKVLQGSRQHEGSKPSLDSLMLSLAQLRTKSGITMLITNLSSRSKSTHIRSRTQRISFP